MATPMKTMLLSVGVLACGGCFSLKSKSTAGYDDDLPQFTTIYSRALAHTRKHGLPRASSTLLRQKGAYIVYVFSESPIKSLSWSSSIRVVEIAWCEASLALGRSVEGTVIKLVAESKYAPERDLAIAVNSELVKFAVSFQDDQILVLSNISNREVAAFKRLVPSIPSFSHERKEVEHGLRSDPTRRFELHNYRDNWVLKSVD